MNKDLTKPANQHNNRLKRLIFRSGHRGCKETDLILGAFAQSSLETLSAPDLDVYERLLDENDADLWEWISGKCSPTHAEYLPFIARFRAQSLKY